MALQVTTTTPGAEGIPKVIFVCSSHGEEFFISESASHWGELYRMGWWCAEARRHRFFDEEITGDTPILNKTANFHMEVIQTYNETLPLPYGIVPITVDELFPEPPRPAMTLIQQTRLKAIRRRVLQDWQPDDKNSFDHTTHNAVPFSCPSFVTRHRCYKCRAIYNYNIHTGVENWNDDQSGDGNYGPYSCAEVMCHCFCTRDDGYEEAIKDDIRQGKEKKRKLEEKDKEKE